MIDTGKLPQYILLFLDTSSLIHISYRINKRGEASQSNNDYSYLKIQIGSISVF